MCAEAMLRAKLKNIERSLGVKVLWEDPQEEWDLHIFGYKKIKDKAPVIYINDEGQVAASLMDFSLTPSWSKEYPTPFSTYNARLNRPKRKDKKLLRDEKGELIFEYIYEIPTWRDSFKNRRCLIPLSEAVESCYRGEYAGSIVGFKAPDDLMFVGGLWDRWEDKSTGEVKDSFTLITLFPTERVYEAGHHRLVYVPKPEFYLEWLNPKSSYRKVYSNVIPMRWDIPFEVEEKRKMKAGWEKRTPELEEWIVPADELPDYMLSEENS